MLDFGLSCIYAEIQFDSTDSKIEFSYGFTLAMAFLFRKCAVILFLATSRVIEELSEI